MQVLDREGGGVPEDDASFGELLVQGHWVAREYYRETTPLLREGWLPTGDVVRVDQEKSLLIVDRLKDMIRSGGEWISSMALEAVALTSPEVADAAVIARPDERWGERPLLIVVPAPGATPSKACILTVMKAALAAWQIPDDVVFIDEIPRTATGKIDKKALRARFCDVVPRTPD
jgi:fatty-acyl-CoA synthase